HLVQEADRLVLDLEQRAPDLDDIAREQFALVGNVLLHASHAVPGFAQIGRCHAETGEEIPVGFVEFADIPHDVHMADVVALPRIDRAAIGCFRHGPPRPFHLDTMSDTVAYQTGGGLAIRYRIKTPAALVRT